MSVHGVSYDTLKEFKVTYIHSLLFFNLDELSKSYMSMIFANFKLLKVMDFEDASLDCILEDVGCLFPLRYLSLRNTKVKMLPKSTRKLQNLETLDLNQSLASNIPIEIKKLHKLRHITAYYRNNQINFSLAWEKWAKIQKGCLKCISSPPQCLQHLYIKGCLEKLPDWIPKLQHLVRLKLFSFFLSRLNETP